VDRTDFFIRIGLITIVLLCTPLLLKAHHATATQFDTSKTIKITGVVSKLDWTNPHGHVSLDVKTSRGNKESWDVELGSPGAIIVAGLSRELLKPGATLTVTGYPGRTNTSAHPPTLSVCATQVTLPGGKTAQFVVGI
jgi:hypothetical protein